MKKILTIFLLISFSLILYACGADTSEGSPENESEPETEVISYSWAATSQSSGFYPFNVAVTDIINNNIENAQVTVLETGGTADNLNLLENGEAQFGQGSEPDIYEAQNGIGLYEGESYENSRLLWLANPLAYYFTVSEESGIESLSELNSADFNPGLQGSSTEILSYDILQDILGYEPNFTPGSLNDAVDGMKDRRIVGFTKTGSTNAPDSSLQDVSTALDIRVLSFTDEEKAKVKEEIPYYQFVDIDGSMYGQEETITSVGIMFGSMVSKDLSEEVVYEIVKTVFENQDYIADAYSGVEGVDMAELTAENAVSWLHPGTVKYLQEQGYELDDSVIPPEMD
jgi:hypothetical protein